MDVELYVVRFVSDRSSMFAFDLTFGFDFLLETCCSLGVADF